MRVGVLLGCYARTDRLARSDASHAPRRRGSGRSGSGQAVALTSMRCDSRQPSRVCHSPRRVLAAGSCFVSPQWWSGAIPPLTRPLVAARERASMIVAVRVTRRLCNDTGGWTRLGRVAPPLLKFEPIAWTVGSSPRDLHSDPLPALLPDAPWPGTLRSQGARTYSLPPLSEVR